MHDTTKTEWHVYTYSAYIIWRDVQNIIITEILMIIAKTIVRRTTTIA